MRLRLAQRQPQGAIYGPSPGGRTRPCPAGRGETRLSDRSEYTAALLFRKGISPAAIPSIRSPFRHFFSHEVLHIGRFRTYRGETTGTGWGFELCHGVLDGLWVSESTADEIADIYKKNVRRIYGYCAYRLFSGQLAEDATAAVFLRLVEHYPALKAKGERGLRQWLYGTASNVAASYLRDAKRRREIQADLSRQRLESLTHGSDDDGRLDWPLLYKAIGRLKRKHQDVIVLRYFQGMKMAAIAEALGMKHGTVRVILSRATKKLHRELGPLFGGPHGTT